MQFKFIDEILPNGAIVDLEILKGKTQKSNVLLYQHEGTLSAMPDKFGNAYNVDEQLKQFFEKAKELDADLALTPEYSCPWTVVSELIVNPECHPALGRLWVIGCESCTLDQLNQLKTELNSDDVFIFFDEPTQTQGLTFLDPMIYMLKSQVGAHEKLVVLIQFKTYHMGVRNKTTERDNLILGIAIYILRNSNNHARTINLMTLICSEAMNFRSYLNQAADEHLTWPDKPFLILNPQCNPIPRHPSFIAFRNFVRREVNKEVISLNWGASSEFVDEEGGGALISDKDSRSAIYSNSHEVDDSDERIQNNHASGMYFYKNKINRFTYLFDSDNHMFLIKLPSIRFYQAVESQQRSDGPEITMAYRYEDGAFHETELICDGHLRSILGTYCKNKYLIDPTRSILDKERLSCLSSGEIKIKAKQKWWIGKNINSMEMCEITENSNRITVANSECSNSVKDRASKCQAISQLDSLLGNPEALPISIKNNGLEVGYYDGAYKDNYLFNVVNAQGEGETLTVVYVDSATEERANKLFDNLVSLLANNGDKSQDRVVVYYGVITSLQSIPKVTTDYSNDPSYMEVEKNPTSILGD